jgi:dienelactone hydrolase
MTVNIRGHGKSGGTIDEISAREFETDALAAYDFLTHQREVDANRIGICGGSFGGLLAAMTSKVRSVKSIMVRAPAAYTPEMREERMGAIIARETRVFNEIDDIENTPAVQAISSFKGDLLVMVCENDATIPRAIPQAYFDDAKVAHRKKIEIIVGAEHSLQTEALRKQFIEREVKWFLETL